MKNQEKLGLSMIGGGIIFTFTSMYLSSIGKEKNFPWTAAIGGILLLGGLVVVGSTKQ